MRESTLNNDANGVAIQAGSLTSPVNQTITIGAASVKATNAMSRSLIMVTATTPCFIKADVTGGSATLADTYLAANVPYVFTLDPGLFLFAIDDGTGGVLYITEL